MREPCQFTCARQSASGQSSDSRALSALTEIRTVTRLLCGSGQLREEWAEDAGYDVAKVLTHDDLVKGENCFFSATGVTDGDVLQGVRYEGARGASTESLVMRSRSGTVREVKARHDRPKLREVTGGRYG